MDTKELAKKLGLPETATEEEILTEVEKLLANQPPAEDNQADLAAAALKADNDALAAKVVAYAIGE